MNEVNNGFTWMECFTQVFHKMTKYGIFKTINGKTVQKWHALFRVEETLSLLRKEKNKLTYFLVSNRNIANAIPKYGQEIIKKLQQHMMHIYIHDTLIPNMLEGMYNGTTKSKILENYVITKLFKETVGECLIYIGFQYDYAVNN